MAAFEMKNKLFNKKFTIKHKASKALRVVSYVLFWLFVWSLVALVITLFAYALATLITGNSKSQTPESLSNTMLVSICIVTILLFLESWYLRGRQSLFMRISRIVLITCTCLGLLIGVPASLNLKYIPETINNGNAQVNKPSKNSERWRYMLCSDGSYRYFTEEQFNSGEGFTKDSGDYCAANGKGVMTGLANEAPMSNQQNVDTESTVPYQQYTSEQNKSEECRSLWNRHYATPKSQLELKLGGKPSTANIVNYIGTSQYESVVSAYNIKAREWNAAISQYEQNFNNATLGMGCNVGLYFGGYSYDMVNEYKI